MSIYKSMQNCHRVSGNNCKRKDCFKPGIGFDVDVFEKKTNKHQIIDSSACGVVNRVAFLQITSQQLRLKYIQ